MLEGVWTVSVAELGDIEFDEITATFDGNGNVVEFAGTTTDGASVTRSASGAATELVGNFEGNLSEDQNTMVLPPLWRGGLHERIVSIVAVGVGRHVTVHPWG